MMEIARTIVLRDEEEEEEGGETRRGRNLPALALRCPRARCPPSTVGMRALPRALPPHGPYVQPARLCLTGRMAETSHRFDDTAPTATFPLSSPHDPVAPRPALLASAPEQRTLHGRQEPSSPTPLSLHSRRLDLASPEAFLSCQHGSRRRRCPRLRSCQTR